MFLNANGIFERCVMIFDFINHYCSSLVDASGRINKKLEFDFLFFNEYFWF